MLMNKFKFVCLVLVVIYTMVFNATVSQLTLDREYVKRHLDEPFCAKGLRFGSVWAFGVECEECLDFSQHLSWVTRPSIYVYVCITLLHTVPPTSQSPSTWATFGPPYWGSAWVAFTALSDTPSPDSTTSATGALSSGSSAMGEMQPIRRQLLLPMKNSRTFFPCALKKNLYFSIGR